MICDICKQEFADVQTFTMTDQQTVKLCRKDYDIMVANYKLTGKLIPRQCKACKSVIGWEWVQYKAPGRKRKGVAGNQTLDTFFDMRSPLERALGEKKGRKKRESKAHDGADLPAKEGSGVQGGVQADDPPGLEGRGEPENPVP